MNRGTSHAATGRPGWWLGTSILVCAAGALATVREPVRVPVDAVRVEMTAHRADWQAAYRLRNGSGPAREVATGREVHVPLGAVVSLTMLSGEYIATFDAPALGLRDFAAPGLPGRFEFLASAVGRYEVRADEMCGLPHPDQFVGLVVVETPDAYRAWVRARLKREL
jgi:heme/copper-type cytochrome/quinol oxidase subunit 2